MDRRRRAIPRLGERVSGDISLFVPASPAALRHSRRNSNWRIATCAAIVAGQNLRLKPGQPGWPTMTWHLSLRTRILIALACCLLPAPCGAATPTLDEVVRICRENRTKLDPLHVQFIYAREVTDAYRQSF